MLYEYGWSDSVFERLSVLSEPDTYPGRVVRVDRGQFRVATDQGIVSCFAGANLSDGGVAVGDWAVVRGDDQSGRTIVGLADRTSAIVRRDPSPANDRDQVLAANLDYAFILYRIDRPLRLGVIERYLVLIWDSGAIPVVVLSKADLVSFDEVVATTRQVRLGAPGVDVVAVSGITGSGLDELEPFVGPGKSVALVGESGVGKSTLVNRLIGNDLLDTGQTRSGDGKGRHTTTARHLVPLADGAVLIDTPGLRSVGLTDAHDGISHVFADVEAFMMECRFRNCSHGTEPGCAIVGAIEQGVLERRRFESYLKLEREQERLEERKAAIARRAERKEAANKRARVED